MAATLTVGVTCPTCGGTLTLDDGVHSCTCSFCNTLLWVEGDDGVRTVTYECVVTKEKAEAAVGKWLGSFNKAWGLRKASTITEISPISVPYWRLLVRAAGWVCGYNESTSTDSHGNRHTTKTWKKQMIFQDFEDTNIACDLGELGIKSLANTKGHVVATASKDVPTFDVTTSRSEAENGLKATLRSRAIASANVEHQTFVRMQVMPRTFSLLYYPLWVVRYRYRERDYFATVDGVTGRVLSGRAPGSAFLQSLGLTTAAAIGGTLCATSLVTSWVETDMIAIHLLMPLLGVGLFLVGWVSFRYGSEVVQGALKTPFQEEWAERGIRVLKFW